MSKEFDVRNSPITHTIFHLSAVTTDIVSHLPIHDKNNEILRRNPLRDALPTFIGEHIGNYSSTAVPIIAAGFFGSLLMIEGEQQNQPWKIRLGKYLPLVTITTLILTNIWVERGFLTDSSLVAQNYGDMAMGGLAIITAAATVDLMNKKLRIYLTSD